MRFDSFFFKRLPYVQSKRRVIFEKPQVKKFTEEPQKNLIIEWDIPKINIKQHVNWLGVEKTDPEEYKNKHFGSLIKTEDLPDFVKDLDRESGYTKYVSELANKYELEGDLEALKHVDLEKEGLSEYRNYFTKKNSSEYSTQF